MSRLHRSSLTILAAVTLLFATTAVAQVSYRLGGKVAAEFGVAVDGTIPVAAADLTIRVGGEVGSGIFPDAIFVAEAGARYDAASTEPFAARLGRAYATVYLGPVDLTVGNQIIAWGSVDAVNPVDVVNPRDLSDPVSDPAEQRLPTPAIRAVIHAQDGVTVDLVVVPVFVPSTLPGARWQAGATPLPQLPPGMTIVGVLDPVTERPEFALENVQFGARATIDLDLGAGADVSVTAYRGFRHLPTVSADLVPTATPGAFELRPRLNYDRITLIGTDFSAVVGEFVLRGEAAYTFSGDPDGTDPVIGNDAFAAVVGAETNLAGGPFVTLQAAYERTAPDSGAEAQQSLSTVVGATYEPDNRLGLTFAWLHDWLDGSGVIRPQLDYTFADGVVGTAKATILYGSEGSSYGGWRDNTELRVGVAFSF